MQLTAEEEAMFESIPLTTTAAPAAVEADDDVPPLDDGPDLSAEELARATANDLAVAADKQKAEAEKKAKKIADAKAAAAKAAADLAAAEAEEAPPPAPAPVAPPAPPARRRMPIADVPAAGVLPPDAPASKVELASEQPPPPPAPKAPKAPRAAAAPPPAAVKPAETPAMAPAAPIAPQPAIPFARGAVVVSVEIGPNTLEFLKKWFTPGLVG